MANALLPALPWSRCRRSTASATAPAVLDLNASPATTDRRQGVAMTRRLLRALVVQRGAGRRRLAPRAGATPVADAAQAGDAVALRALLKQGADVNSSQGDGMTALHWAALHGDTTMVSMLVARGREPPRDDASRRLHAAPSRQPERPVGSHRCVDCRRRRRSRAHIHRGDRASACRARRRCRRR